MFYRGDLEKTRLAALRGLDAAPAARTDGV